MAAIRKSRFAASDTKLHGDKSQSSLTNIHVKDVPLHTTVELKSKEPYPSEEARKQKEVRDEEQALLEQEAAKLKDIRVRDQLDRIEYAKFPSILGWYFDGSYSTPFKLNKIYAEYFSEVEEEMELKRNLQIRETFEEKAARNFWPPKWFGPFFRTRGVYLDMQEVREDPPKTPPDCSMPGDGRSKFGMDYGTASGRRPGDPRDQWFWTDETREFMFKSEEDRYEWWEQDGVWRLKQSEEKSPYAWYWNPKEGKFFERDKFRLDLYTFEQSNYVYVAKHIFGPAENGYSPADYFYCEITNRWIPLKEAEKGETEFYTNGRRFIRKGPRPKNGHYPDDFYYSAESGLMTLKDQESDYYYDTRDEVFKKYTEPYGPGKSGLYPTDYVWSEKNGVFLPKNPKELYKPSCYDWYFDDALGRFYPRDKTVRDDYEFDQDLLVWRLKDVIGPSANGLGPEDYIYDEIGQEWRLINSVPVEEIFKQESTKRNIIVGVRGTSGHKEDDFYYDAIEGKFILKDLKELNNYFYYVPERIFRKKGQSFGPGKLQHYAKDYYFDEVEGEWLLTQIAKTKHFQNLTGPKLLRTLYKTPYDYAFDAKDGTYVLRDPKTPSNYEYNPHYAVYMRKGIRFKGPSINGKNPTDYYFDENEFKWKSIDDAPPEEVENDVILYPTAKRFLKLGVRGKSGKIPDDFYFHDGTFSLKDPENPEDYVYDHIEGAWRATNDVGAITNSKKKPSDFFFSHEDGVFHPKTKLKYHQFIYDGNPPLYVQTFRAPDDYYWDGSTYALKPPIYFTDADGNTRASMRLGKGKRFRAKKKKDKKKKADGEGDEGAGAGGGEVGVGGATDSGVTDYERPWLHNFVYQASDRIRFVQEVDKLKAREGTTEAPKSKNDSKGKEAEKKVTKTIAEAAKASTKAPSATEPAKTSKKKEGTNAPVPTERPKTAKIAPVKPSPSLKEKEPVAPPKFVKPKPPKPKGSLASFKSFAPKKS